MARKHFPRFDVDSIEIDRKTGRRLLVGYLPAKVKKPKKVSPAYWRGAFVGRR